jgi:serine/threonine protein kinase/photosystem II stability/assembly factor-like uncharacterized protein
MSQTHLCSCGNQWQSSGDEAGASLGVALCCPVCGAVCGSVTGTSLRAVELPPPLDSPTTSGPTVAPAAPWPAGGAWPVIAGYEMLGELGRGGMGVVFKAKQLRLKRIVALKMLLARSLPGSLAVARFRTEAEAVARLGHANIVHVYDIGEQDGCPYIAMEFVDGQSLHHKLAGWSPTPRQAAELLLPLVRAMHHAHERSIVHRDLKPANVLIDKDGTLRITDFGLAKQLDDPVGQTQSGAIMGTPSYMAPEQAQGRSREIGPATDVYALGAILYQLLTSVPPFRAATTLDVLVKVVSEAPVPPHNLRPDVPRDLEAICLRCLQKEAMQRYQSALDLAGDLDRFLAGAPILANPTTREGTPPRKQRRLPGMRLAFAAVAVLAVLAAGWWWLSTRTDKPEPLPDKTPPEIAATPSWETFRIGPADETFQRIAFPTRKIGYAASRTALHKTTDGGENWKRILADKLDGIGFLHFGTERVGWFGGAVLRTTQDGGKTWAPVWLPGGADLQSITTLAEGPKGWMLAGGSTEAGDLVLYQRPSNGSAWIRLDPVQAGYQGGAGEPYRQWVASCIAIRAAGQAVLLLVGNANEGGVLLATSDGGLTWQETFRSPEDLYCVRFINDKRGWLTGSRGALWSTEDGGTRWQPQTHPGTGSIGCLAFASTESPLGIAPLWKGKVLLRKQQQWHEIDVKLGYSMPSAVVVDRGCAYVLGGDGRLARYTDPGVAVRP